jgi:hypothetical protein
VAGTGGFWSYVHADDDAEGGRIVQLAKDVSAQYEAITAEPLDVFLDSSALEWGDDWLNKVDQALASIAFFIPVVTPRYFQSLQCRRELQTFVHRATELGIRELVLPVVYIDVPVLHDADPSDEAVKTVKTYQWEDWREVRFEERESKVYRVRVAALAQRLVEINQRLITTPALNVDATAPGDVDDENTDGGGQENGTGPPSNGDDESPGDLDLMAVAEATLPRWNEVVLAVSALIEQVSTAAAKATAGYTRSDKQGKGFAGRITVTKRLATELKPLATHMLELGNEYTAHMYAVDPGVRAMIRMGAVAADDPSQRDAVCNFFQAVRGMSEGAADGVSGLRAMVDSIAPLEPLSRELRPALRQLRQGLTMMIEGQSVTDEWARLIDAAGVECDDPDV